MIIRAGKSQTQTPDFLKGETANIRIICEVDDVPCLEASVSNEPNKIGEARAFLSDLSRHLTNPSSREALRKDIVEFLDQLITYGVADISRDYWNDVYEDKRISKEVKNSYNPNIQLDLKEMKEISEVLDEEIPLARTRLLE